MRRESIERVWTTYVENINGGEESNIFDDKSGHVTVTNITISVV